MQISCGMCDEHRRVCRGVDWTGSFSHNVIFHLVPTYSGVCFSPFTNERTKAQGNRETAQMKQWGQNVGLVCIHLGGNALFSSPPALRGCHLAECPADLCQHQPWMSAMAWVEETPHLCSAAASPACVTVRTVMGKKRKKTFICLPSNCWPVL